jgi:hypothetical protein
LRASPAAARAGVCCAPTCSAPPASPRHGADAALFLAEVKQLLQAPLALSL